MKKWKLLLLAVTIFLSARNGAHAEEVLVLENRHVAILFEAQLEQAAERLAEIYPRIRKVLENDIGWALKPKPSVFLLRDRERFAYLANTPLIVGFAVPERNIIVIDYTRMTQDPFSLGNTLKHELCHLLLHHHIPAENLPRWLDEGVCQWVSNWVGDMVMSRKHSYLDKAAVSGSFLSLRALHHGFPRDPEGMQLAYEQSKSVVSYVIRQFGRQALLDILQNLKNGNELESAVSKALSLPLDKLEIQWRRSVGAHTVWWVRLSYHLYEILFGLTALTAVFAFIKLMRKKRAYGSGEDGH